MLHDTLGHGHTSARPLVPKVPGNPVGGSLNFLVTLILRVAHILPTPLPTAQSRILDVGKERGPFDSLICFRLQAPEDRKGLDQ